MSKVYWSFHVCRLPHKLKYLELLNKLFYNSKFELKIILSIAPFDRIILGYQMQLKLLLVD